MERLRAHKDYAAVARRFLEEHGTKERKPCDQCAADKRIETEERLREVIRETSYLNEVERVLEDYLGILTDTPTTQCITDEFADKFNALETKISAAFDSVRKEANVQVDKNWFYIEQPNRKKTVLDINGQPVRIDFKTYFTFQPASEDKEGIFKEVKNLYDAHAEIGNGIFDIKGCASIKTPSMMHSVLGHRDNIVIHYDIEEAGEELRGIAADILRKRGVNLKPRLYGREHGFDLKSADENNKNYNDIYGSHRQLVARALSYATAKRFKLSNIGEWFDAEAERLSQLDAKSLAEEIQSIPDREEYEGITIEKIDERERMKRELKSRISRARKRTFADFLKELEGLE